MREPLAEVEGEKAVTRQVYQQPVRDSDALRAVQLAVTEVTSRPDHVVQEVNGGGAHSRRRLDTLTRDDVGLLRNDVTALRRRQEELHVRLDGWTRASTSRTAGLR